MDQLILISEFLSKNLNIKKEQIETIVELLKNGVNPEIISKILEDIQKESERQKYN